ncbi:MULTISPECIES: shikimate dehydrogenase [unclassified Microbacterium]|uniref:shikimate dehydrogenase n=1 Tax=unclassified Microbacterium TaxID=2609290 RepID=UPI00214B45C6|nr:MULTISPECIES: shikimate dehydrogenase [unclassified Microbacterium]MCR2785947.1 shikimate dehydrogenase [Microbacterium sp. zg.B96]MDL5353159.1 shikimate dehydrogenase [Microbacterium sp. zg-YB36]WIM17081.1 shikimate dehydrogenase [Microbacterium sp. zg-B96]
MTEPTSPIRPRAHAPRAEYLVGLIGEGITASLTPPMHEAEAAALGLDYEYRILDLLELGKSADDVGELLAEARGLGYAAMNITHPCKQRVLGVVDELDPDAERLGAVNLVVFRDGRLVGYNTDWMGYRDALAAGLPGASFERVVQVGCGGAGAATAYALLSCGTARLALSDVDAARAEELAERMRAHFPSQVIATVAPEVLGEAIALATGVVHATPMGMRHMPGVPIDLDRLRPSAWVSDVVYRPLQTELLRQAAQRGHAVLDGGRMAVGQAYASLEIITGQRPDRERMARHFADLIRREAADGAAGGAG